MRTLPALLGILTICLCLGSAHAAPVTLNVSGDLGTSLFGNLSPGPYPFPGLLGGSFDGSFSYDTAAAAVVAGPTASQFPFLNVSVDIKDSGGTTVHTIASGPNNMLVVSGRTQLRFGPSGGFPGVPGDLRLSFNDASFNPADTVPPPPASFLAATFNSSQLSFLEVDGSAPFTFWDLDVPSAQLGSERDAIPEPATFALAAFGLTALGGYVRRRRKA